MNGNNKRFAIGWMAGVALGLGSSAALVYAVSIPNTFTSGQTASAQQVNDNFTALKNAVDALETGADCTGDDVVSVGALCVDKFRARADFAACAADGSDCTVAAASTGEGAPTVDMSWAQAARACANAGKRLPSPSEWLAAFTSGELEETGVDQLEFVDAVLTLNSTFTATDPSSPGANRPAQVGYMGPRAAADGKVQMITNIDYDQRDADAASSTDFLFFRCVR